MKILNYARGELVNTAALLEAMETGKVSGYMTDFPTEAILGKPGIVCTPHLGASTPEAEDNCAAMAVQEISDYLKNGNITHSVNMPEVHQPRAGGKRICIIHKNEPGMISQITALTTEAGLNIENMVNKSKRTWLTPCWTRPVPWTAGWLRSWPPSLLSSGCASCNTANP